MSLTEDTGIWRWRRWLRPLLAAATTPEPTEDTQPGQVYGFSNREPGDATTALGRHRTTRAHTVAPRSPDLSLEQATQVIPLLDRTLRSLDLQPEEAVIYGRLAASWRALPGNERPGDEGPATDHTADAVRLPALDQEGGESRD